MPGEIKIILGGDASGLVRSSQEGSSALDQLKKSADSTGPSLNSLGPAVDKATASLHRFKDGVRAPTGELSKIGNSTDAATKALAKVSPAANAANGALLDVSRVAQDLPYGFIGIANNLTQLPQSFQRLSQAAKESGKSIGSALLSSISGIGGIGLAISVLTAGITIYQNGIAGFNKKTKEAKDSADDLKKAIRSVADIQGEATASVQGQIATVNALSKAVVDETKSQTERKRALEQLREVNKAYFGDLTLEAAQLATLKTRVEDYTKALIQQAVAKGFEEDIVAIKKAQVKADKELAKSRLDVADAQAKINDANLAALSDVQGREGVGNTRQQAAAQKELADATLRQREASATATDLKAQELVLTDQLNRSVLEGLKFKSLTTEGTKKETDALKAQIEALEKLQDLLDKANLDSTSVTEKLIPLKIRLTIRDAKKNGLSQEEVDLQIRALQKELNEAFKKQAIRLESIKLVPEELILVEISKKKIKSAVAKATGFDKEIEPIKMPALRIQFFGIEVGSSLNEAIAQMDLIKKTLREKALDGLGDAADIFGQTIGGIFSGENVGNALAQAAKGFLGIVGGVLQAVGREIIVTSKLVKALKNAIDKLFGHGGEIIAAGVGLALIAFGGALKNIQFNVPKFANGGIATKATLGIFGEAGKEAIIPLDRLPDLMGNVNAAQPALVLQPSIRFEGADFRIMLQEVDQRRGRLG